MKRLFTILFPLLCAAFIFAACSSDDNYSYEYYYSYGNVAADESGGNGYSIILDSGNELVINDNRVPNAEVEDGDRIYAKYSLLGQQSANGHTVYTVDLYGISKVLEKTPVLQSDIDDPDNTEVSEEIIGDDPVKLTLAIVGGRYLTVEFWIYTKRGSDVQHFINLVRDDTRVPENPDDKTVYLELRHNGYDDVPQPGNIGAFAKTYGSVSFDISSILPEGSTSVPIKISWTEYGLTLNDRVQYSIERTFNYTQAQEQLMRASGISRGSSQISSSYVAPYLIR